MEIIKKSIMRNVSCVPGNSLTVSDKQETHVRRFAP